MKNTVLYIIEHSLDDGGMLEKRSLRKTNWKIINIQVLISHCVALMDVGFSAHFLACLHLLLRSKVFLSILLHLSENLRHFELVWGILGLIPVRNFT